MTPERVVIGDATLWHGDWRDVADELRGCDAVVSDPPYGQAHKVNTFYAGGTRKRAIVQRGGSVAFVDPNVYPDIHGDDEPFDPVPVLALAPAVILWGAHKFGHRLPEGSTLVWDKVPTGKVRDQGDGEAAWDSRPGRPLRIFRLLWDGLSVGAAARMECTAGQQRVHPTQKPVALMRWCIEQAGRPRSIVDPYMGAGSTGVAAVELGCRFVGVEIERRYFDIACERIARAAAQPALIPHESPRPEQASMELAP